ncbi:hypothetical protein C6I21_06045 [Alkalicoccus urumqiensis]|uniref:Uncharacterized protein n=1 Tax=Alkalicoccus urumqiensis TaxID=1548213 RepID=A0A2P6MJA7_ALKUR|nr:hypothetical protein C6I21_05675 [Alkalicoccus urumqiensis]PRO66362.1 hypothetical protein C6I21_06045 [Alkalicoccus urumqiensis]
MIRSRVDVYKAIPFLFCLPKPEAVDSGRIRTRRKSMPRSAAESASGAGLWFKPQDSGFLSCGAAARSRASYK